MAGYQNDGSHAPTNGLPPCDAVGPLGGRVEGILGAEELITSLTPDQADSLRLLELARQYWSIENGTHYRLDVSSGEDRCRVRHPIASTVLGILRRAVQGEYRAWARRQRKARDSTCPAFQEHMSRRINLIIRYVTGDVSRL